MLDNDFSSFYEELYSRPLAEPRNEHDVKNILSCIRAQHGQLDSEDDEQLLKTTSVFRKKMAMMAAKARQVLAEYTKA